MTITVLAIGTIKRDASAELCTEYAKRLKTKTNIIEIDLKDANPARLQEKESEALLARIPKDSFLVALDGRGKQLASPELAKKMGQWQQSARHIVFLIGGADGHTDKLLKKADFTLSFGAMTWPHRLARVMLLEQLYRAQQISAGHPYHRE